MDPVTTAIAAALAAGAAAGMTDVGKKIIVDGYDALKGILKKKFGTGSDLVVAIAELENKPESAARHQVLQEEVEATKASQDPEVLAAAQALLGEIKAQPDGEQHVQIAVGKFIAQADRGGTATVNVTGRNTEDD